MHNIYPGDRCTALYLIERLTSEEKKSKQDTCKQKE